MRYFGLWALAMMVVLPQLALAAGWKWIEPRRVHTLQGEGAGLWIVDVRPPAAYDQGHIEGAIGVPGDFLKLKKFPKNKVIILVDDSLGLRVARGGAETLARNGCEKVFVLDGGIPAWQEESLPFVGARSDKLRPVMWNDLAWARSNSIPMRIYDARDKQERSKGPVEGARELAGATLDQRLTSLTAELGTTAKPSRKPVMKPERQPPLVLVLPASTQALDTARRVLRRYPGDVRYLEGAYPLWAAREKGKPLPGPGFCPTCPAGRGEK